MERKAATRVTDLLGNPDDWDSSLKSLAAEFIKGQVAAGVAAGAIEAGLPPDLAVVNPKVLEWTEKYAAKLAKRINETTRENLTASMDRVMRLYDAGTIREAIDKGASINEFRDSIQAVLGDETNAYRAEMTAVTEYSRSEQTGRLEQLKEAGAVRKLWRANPDCCDFCAAMDGQDAGIEENFLNVGDSVNIEDENGNPQSLNVDYDNVDVGLLHPWCRCSYSVEFE